MADLVRRWPTVAAGVGFFAISLIAMAGFLAMALAFDAPYYLYSGEVVFSGGMPYVDFADNKGPLNSVFFGVIELLTFESAAAVRVLFCGIVAISAVALMRAVGRELDRRVALLIALTFVLLVGSVGMEGGEPNTEQLAMAFVLCAWWAAGSPRRWSPGASGLLMMSALLVNPVTLLFVPLIGWELLRRSAHARLRRVSAFIGASLLLAVPVALWLIAGGALDDMRQQLGGQSGSYAIENLLGQLTSLSGISGLLDVPLPGFWLLALVGAGIALTESRLRPLALAAIIWMFVVWFRIEVSNYVLLHHWLPVMPALCIGAGLGIAWLWGRDRARYARVATAALVLVAPVWVYSLEPSWRMLPAAADTRWGTDHPYVNAPRVAAFIRSNVSPGEPIIVIGGFPAVEWLSGNPAPTRWFDTPPVRWWPAHAESERRSDLLADPPVAIAGLSQEEVSPDPAIAELLERYDYHLAFNDGGHAKVWLRQ